MLRALVVAFMVTAAPAAAQAIGGTYAVEGRSFDGSVYRGQAEILLTSDYTCRIRWVTGGQVSEGICMRQDGVFAAAYILAERVGMVIYTVNPDGTMQGTWTVDGVNAVGSEVLVPQ